MFALQVSLVLVDDLTDTMAYPLFTGSLGLARPAFNAASSGPTRRNIEFRPARGMLEIEWIELLADAFQNDTPLESFFVSGPFILRILSPLLLRLLWACDPLLSEGSLEALKL